LGHYAHFVIGSFRHKGLHQLFVLGKSSKVGANLRDRALRRLDALDAAGVPEHLNVPGFDFHALRGKPRRYSIHVNGPWCIPFEWADGDAVRVDLEQYH
jgi:proteic killer suppression protein